MLQRRPRLQPSAVRTECSVVSPRRAPCWWSAARAACPGTSLQRCRTSRPRGSWLCSRKVGFPLISTPFASQLPAGGTVFKAHLFWPTTLAPYDLRTLLRRLCQQTELMKMRVSWILFTFWPKQVCVCGQKESNSKETSSGRANVSLATRRILRGPLSAYFPVSSFSLLDSLYDVQSTFTPDDIRKGAYSEFKHRFKCVTIPKR